MMKIGIKKVNKVNKKTTLVLKKEENSFLKIEPDIRDNGKDK